MSIYLDYHAHAPLDPRVLETLTSSYQSDDANPDSRHRHGERARSALSVARAEVAALLDASASEIVFTSGATEANNLALEGSSEVLASRGRRRILIGATEHASVLLAAERLGDRGFEIERVPVGPDGGFDAATIARMAGSDTGLVSIAAANHEIGTLQPIAALSAAARAAGALFHSDLSQALGKVEVRSEHLDLASLSSHKMCGPVGVGALFVARRVRARFAASLVGGGQEGGARSGSVPVPLCVAFGTACRIAGAESAEEAVRVGALRDTLLSRMVAIGGITLNGRERDRLAGNINVCIDGVDGEALVMRLRDVASLSTGSACSSRSLTPSHVLLALGLGVESAETAIRIGLGRFTTDDEIETAAEAIEAAVRELRAARTRTAA